MDRAYALLSVKTFDEPRRTFTGMATTPTPDRVGDIFEPLGVSFKNPLPLLLHHDKTKPVGSVVFDPPTAAGIAFTATIPEVQEPGAVKDRLDEAWHSVKAGLIRGVSVGFRALKDGVQPIKGSAGLRLSKTEVCELSLVTVPANAEATILSIKALDAPFLAASGRPSVPASRGVSLKAPTMKQTIAEQIAAWENTRATKDARRSELMTKAADEGVTLDDAQATEYETLKKDIGGIDDHIARLREQETVLRTQAKAPVAAEPTRVASIQVKSMLPAGTGFTRYAMALAASRGSRFEAAEFAKQWQDSTPEVALALKAQVNPGDTTTTAWAGALVPPFQYMANEFMELLRPATLLGKIPNLRRVPFRALVPKQTGGGTYGWVGEKAPKPATKLAFGTVSLGMDKIAGIITLTQELVKLSQPSAEAIVRADMIAGIAQFMDLQFINPGVAATSVSPASITNGLAGVPATADPLADLTALIEAFATANLSLQQATFIMSEVNAFALSTRYYSTGAKEFPDLSINGGTIFGVPVVVSQTAAQWIILVYGPGILFADDGGVSIDVSMEASIQMSDTPDNPVVPGTTSYVSLWQNNLVGLRAERFCSWVRGRDEGVAYLTGAHYIPAAPLARAGNGTTHDAKHK